MILLDTHALVWLDQGDHRLGEKSLGALDVALQSNELFVSAISFWEVAILVEKDRLEMQIEVDVWRQSLIDNGLQEVALAGNTAVRAAQLKDFHGDPADRMIVASAINLGASLCSADEKILQWQGKLTRLDARV